MPIPPIPLWDQSTIFSATSFSKLLNCVPSHLVCGLLLLSAFVSQKLTKGNWRRWKMWRPNTNMSTKNRIKSLIELRFFCLSIVQWLLHQTESQSLLSYYLWNTLTNTDTSIQHSYIDQSSKYCIYGKLRYCCIFFLLEFYLPVESWDCFRVMLNIGIFSIFFYSFYKCTLYTTKLQFSKKRLLLNINTVSNDLQWTQYRRVTNE